MIIKSGINQKSFCCQTKPDERPKNIFVCGLGWFFYQDV